MKYMKTSLSVILALLMILSLALTSCTMGKQPSDDTETQGDETHESGDESAAEKVDSDITDIPKELQSEVNTLQITTTEGTENCWSFNGKVLTFTGLTADTTCTIAGEFDGQIVIDAGDDYKFELEMGGLKLYSSTANPIEILSGDKVTLSAKKETENYVYDTREDVSDDDETAHKAAIYAACDLDIQGKGELCVISSNNNGIHTKDDLSIKNITLSVTCEDNALKGNDSVEITGGVLTLIAKTGDGIKTSNTDVSSKGNQRGIVTVSGGTVNIYAACDGIDAAYDADISDEAVVNIYTDKYSSYSESVETVTDTENVRFIRFTSNSYKYSVKYYNSDTDYKWVNATYYKSVSGGFSTYYYYSFEKLTTYSSVQIFIYSSTQTQGQGSDYLVATDYLTWNTAYDTFALTARGSSLSYNWTNYTTTVNSGMGGMGGMGGDGNSEKSEYSTKGIKAGNEIHISGGTVFIKSYDDALHANSETELENGGTPTGNITISGGTLTLFSKDDGVHADGTLTVSGGKVEITGCYEGLEGTTVDVTGGNISVISSDDGFNSTATTGVGITIEGGTIYIYAGGDGMDANSRTSYQGIVFSGGNTVVISTSGGNSSIDTEQGYTYTDGIVLALCPANGMGSESTKCQNFTSIGKKTTMNLTKGQKLSVKVNGTTTTSVTMPCGMSSLVIYLGSSSAAFTTD